MENGLKVVLIAAGAFIVVALIGVGMYFFNTGSSTLSAADEQLGETNKQMEEMEYTRLDKTTVKGSTVVSKIKEYEDRQGDILVQVATNIGGTDQYVSTGTVTAVFDLTGSLTAAAGYDADLTDAVDDTNADYINPQGDFFCNIGRDANNVIRVISFVQN